MTDGTRPRILSIPHVPRPHPFSQLRGKKERRGGKKGITGLRNPEGGESLLLAD